MCKIVNSSFVLFIFHSDHSKSIYDREGFVNRQLKGMIPQFDTFYKYPMTKYRMGDGDDHDNMIDLIEKMLKWDPAKRLTPSKYF